MCNWRQPGSIPIFLIIGPASGAVRNFTNALAASGAGAAVCKPAEYTVMFWMPDDFDETLDRLQRHMLPDTILPDYEIIDLKQRAPAVNYLMLYDLAQRAERGRDPYVNLAEMYHSAEVSWAKGDFKAAFQGSSSAKMI